MVAHAEPAVAPGVLGRLTVRTFATVLGALALIVLIPTIGMPWFSPGTMGFLTSNTSTVTFVRPESSAKRAGMLVGDRILHREPNVGVQSAGTNAVFKVERNGRLLDLQVYVVPRPAWDPISTLIHVVMVLFDALAIAATVALALRHPSWATALLTVASLNFIIEADVWAMVGRVVTADASVFVKAVIENAVTVLPSWFFVLFALAFPRRMWSRTRALAAVPIIAIIVALTFAPVPLWVNQSIVFVAYPLAFACFALSYARAEPSDQRRLTWLMVAVGIALFADVGVNLLSILEFTGPNIVGIRAFNVIGAIAWLGIVYVVWRRNVIGVAFAVNRGLVVAVITAALLGVVSLARWLGEHLLVRSGIVGFFEVAATVLFGYGLNTFAQRIQATIERFVFRNRYAAEQRVLRTIAALPFASTRTTIDEAVVNEVCDELRLTSAALFLVDGDRYVRVRDANWRPGTASVVDGEDRLVRVLRAENKMLFLRDLQWRRNDLPSGDEQAVVVIPLMWRAQLTGFAVYGRHRDGSDLDPQELTLLQRVIDAATVTYETAELGELRRRVASLERQLVAALPG